MRIKGPLSLFKVVIENNLPVTDVEQNYVIKITTSTHSDLERSYAFSFARPVPGIHQVYFALIYMQC